MAKSIGRSPFKTATKGKAVAHSAAPSVTRTPAPKRGAKGGDFSINEIDFPFIGRIKNEGDVAKEINEFAKGGRKHSLVNALNVAVSFQYGLDLGFVRWGTYKLFVEKYLDYKTAEVTKFRKLLSERPIMQKADAFYEENKDSLIIVTRRKGAGVDFQVQKHRAYLKYEKAIKGSAKEPALGHDEALERVIEEMTPKASASNAVTTSKEREAILVLLVANSAKDHSIIKNWNTPYALTNWLMTIHPDVKDCLLDEADASGRFGNEAFGKIPYPARMAKLWGWKEGKPDTGDDENFGGSDRDQKEHPPADPNALKLEETPRFPYPVQNVDKPDDLQENWEYLTRCFNVTAQQIATWAGMQKAAKALRAKVHPDKGGEEVDAQKVGGALDVLISNHPKNPQNPKNQADKAA